MVDIHELPADPRELLTRSEHEELNDHLAALANLRRRAEAESRDIPIGVAVTSEPGGAT